MCSGQVGQFSLIAFDGSSSYVDVRHQSWISITRHFVLRCCFMVINTIITITQQPQSTQQRALSLPSLTSCNVHSRGHCHTLSSLTNLSLPSRGHCHTLPSLASHNLPNKGHSYSTITHRLQEHTRGGSHTFSTINYCLLSMQQGEQSHCAITHQPLPTTEGALTLSSLTSRNVHSRGHSHTSTCISKHIGTKN